jgi:hypothetical protein
MSRCEDVSCKQQRCEAAILSCKHWRTQMQQLSACTGAAHSATCAQAHQKGGTHKPTAQLKCVTSMNAMEALPTCKRHAMLAGLASKGLVVLQC